MTGAVVGPETRLLVRGGVPGLGPRWPYWLLVGFYVLACGQLLATVLGPPLPATDVRWQSFVLSLTSVLLIASVILAFTARGSSALPVLVFGGLVAIILITFRAAGGQGQLMAGVYLTLLGLIAALTLRRRWLMGLVVTGSFMYLLATNVRSLLDSRAYAVGMTVLFALVSLAVQDLVDRLSRQATRDSLTGALNRRGLELNAVMAHDRDRRAGSDTTVLEIDLDGFKGFNDAHGHAAGDAVLCGLVADWTRVLRRTDLLGRVGGDEFVVVLPATSAQESKQLLDRMRGANQIPWTAGLASWDGSESLWQAVEKADAEMYARKVQDTPRDHRP